jgi:hypothetical protein
VCAGCQVDCPHGNGAPIGCFRGGGHRRVPEPTPSGPNPWAFAV